MGELNDAKEIRASGKQKTYTTPRLVAYGSLEKLTQGGGGMGNDPGGMTML